MKAASRLLVMGCVVCASLASAHVMARGDGEMSRNTQVAKNTGTVTAIGANGNGFGVQVNAEATAGSNVLKCAGGTCSNNTQVLENKGTVTAIGAATAGSNVMDNR